MPTAQQYENDAREALAAAQTILEVEGAGPAYQKAFDAYKTAKQSYDAAVEMENEQKALGRSEKDTPKPSELRNPDDADWVKGATSEEKDKGVDGVMIKGANGRPEWMPYAGPDREGWIKQYPVSVQHPSVLKRLPEDLSRKKALEEEAFSLYLRKGLAGFRDDSKSHLYAHLKDLQEGTDSEGGYLVPTDQRTDLIVDPNTPGGVTRGVSSVFTTTRDGGTWPFLSTDVAMAAIAEEAAGSESDPAFNQLSFTIRKVGRNVDVSEELLSDNAVNLPAVLGGIYTRSRGRYEDQQAVEGDGSTEPLGLRTTGATQGNIADITDLWTLAAPTAIEVVAAFYELPAQFRPNATWHMSSGIWSNIITIGSAAAGVHLVDRIQDAVRPLLLGRPVVFWDGTGWDHTDGALPIGANEEVGAIGDFSFYYFIDRVGMTVRRSDDAKFESDQVVFKARVRYDSFFAENNAFRILKGAAS